MSRIKLLSDSPAYSLKLLKILKVKIIRYFGGVKIIIEPYNIDWKVLFEKESNKLHNSLGRDMVIIEHIGSTSVVGLGAKPIIDIMVGINDVNQLDSFVSAIEYLGYNYVYQYENMMPNRRFFIKDSQRIRSYHIHMVEYNTDFWKRHLRFRNRLRRDEGLREKYYNLKLGLSKKDWKDVDEYAAAKSQFIKEIE